MMAQKALKILVNNDAIRAHFTALTEWKDSGFFEWYGTGWDDNQKPFEDGDVAIWLGSSGSFGGLMSKDLGFDILRNLPAVLEKHRWQPSTKQTFIGGACPLRHVGQAALRRTKRTGEVL